MEIIMRISLRTRDRMWGTAVLFLFLGLLFVQSNPLPAQDNALFYTNAQIRELGVGKIRF